MKYFCLKGDLIVMHQETTFIRNQGNITVLSDLLTSLDQCDGFCFTVAFMTFSGVQLLVQKLYELQKLHCKKT